MATIRGLTAERMLEIEAASVVDGTVDENGDLILVRRDWVEINAGNVIGPKGDPADQTITDGLAQAISDNQVMNIMGAW